MTERKEEVLRHYQCEANPAKERLMDIASRLEEAGLVRQAQSLETIIWRLEAWQNTPLKGH